jgi:hypothetical protein
MPNAQYTQQCCKFAEAHAFSYITVGVLISRLQPECKISVAKHAMEVARCFECILERAGING